MTVIDFILMCIAFGWFASPPLVILFGRTCFIGLHEWEDEWVESGDFALPRPRSKCARCGKVYED